MPNPIDPTGRLTAFGTQLIEIHDRLREELTRLLEDVESYVEGDDCSAQPRTLPAHCLAFCSALEQHHTQEDGTAFAVLLDHNPQLGPVIDELRRDHHLVSGMLRGIEALAADLTPELDAATRRDLQARVEGLAALMESHFTYEERKLVKALDSLSAAST